MINKILITSGVIFISSISLAFSPGEAIQNGYTNEPVRHEIIDWRQQAESSIINGSSFNNGSIETDLEFFFTEGQLKSGHYEWPAEKKSDLINLVTAFEGVVWLEMRKPWSSIDCATIAKTIEESGKTKSEKSMTTLNCKGDSAAFQISETEYVRGPVLSPNKSYSESEFIRYETKTRNTKKCKKWAFLWTSCKKYKTEEYQSPVYGGVVYNYDLKQSETWTISHGSATATGRWKEEWSYFDIEKGLIPIDVSGITVFIKGDVKKNDPWIENNEAHGNSTRTLGDINQLSGSKLKIKCGEKEFFNSYTVTNDYTAIPIPSSEAGQLLINCATETVEFVFENLDGQAQPYSGYEAYVQIDPKYSTLSAQTAISKYSAAISADLKNTYSVYRRYRNLFIPYQYGDFDPTLISPSVKSSLEGIVTENSSKLREFMLEYAEKTGVNITPIKFDVNKLFFDFEEANAWADSQGFSRNDRDYLVGAYRPAVDKNIEIPGWIKDFINWSYTQPEGGEVLTVMTMNDYGSIPEAIDEVTSSVALIHAEERELPQKYPYAYELYNSWLALTESFTVTKRFLNLMEFYNPTIHATLAYGTDAASISSYLSSKLEVSKHSNKPQLLDLTSWDVLTANNRLDPFSSGSPL